MADADEDIIRAVGVQTSADSSDDDDDSPQDFRFLSALTSFRTGSSIPKRGMKDFEPDPTKLQSSTLAASRQAMHSALSYMRVHAPKAHVVGIYNEKTGLTRVKKAKGSMFKSIGRGTVDGGVDLLPEEALWALERGSLDVRWPVDRQGQEAEISPTGNDEDQTDGGPTVGVTYDLEQEDLGITMSLQGAYAALLGEEGLRGGSLTLDRYLVYAGLKRSGFVVLRAEGLEKMPLLNKASLSRASNMWTLSDMYGWLYKLVLKSWTEKSARETQRTGPLVTPGLYRSYDQIYRLVSIIPSGHDVTTPKPDLEPSTLPRAQHPFTTTFNVYKSHPNYRKTAPGTPSFRICVVSARDNLVPTLSELSDLLDEQSPTPAITTSDRAGAQMSVPAMYKRLRHDGRNVILAVVDEGITSYIRVSEAAFSNESVYERVGRGGKRGGGGGRGSGGGRGGRGGRGRGGRGE